jgi:hypothetical protein
MFFLGEVWTQSVISSRILKKLKKSKNLKILDPCDGDQFFEKKTNFADFVAPIFARLGNGESHFISLLGRTSPPLYNKGSIVYWNYFLADLLQVNKSMIKL